MVTGKIEENYEWLSNSNSMCISLRLWKHCEAMFRSTLFTTAKTGYTPMSMTGWLKGNSDSMKPVCGISHMHKDLSCGILLTWGTWSSHIHGVREQTGSSQVMRDMEQGLQWAYGVSFTLWQCSSDRCTAMACILLYYYLISIIWHWTIWKRSFNGKFYILYGIC